MTDAKSVAKSTPASGEVSRATAYQQWVKKLQDEAELTATMDSGNNVAEEILSRILEAESLEDAFKAQESGLQNGKDFVDVEITVHDLELRPSDEKFLEHSALGVYGKVTGARLDTGESFSFFTGAPNVVALLWKARYSGNLPLDCVIKAKDTAKGQLLTLAPLPKRVIRN